MYVRWIIIGMSTFCLTNNGTIKSTPPEKKNETSTPTPPPYQPILAEFYPQDPAANRAAIERAKQKELWRKQDSKNLGWG